MEEAVLQVGIILIVLIIILINTNGYLKKINISMKLQDEKLTKIISLLEKKGFNSPDENKS